MSIILHEILYCFQLSVHPGHICKFSLLPTIKHIQMFWLADDKNFSRPIMHTEWYCCKCFLMYCLIIALDFWPLSVTVNSVFRKASASQIPLQILNVKQYTYTYRMTKHVIKRLFGFNFFIEHLICQSNMYAKPVTPSASQFNIFTFPSHTVYTLFQLLLPVHHLYISQSHRLHSFNFYTAS